MSQLVWYRHAAPRMRHAAPASTHGEPQLTWLEAVAALSSMPVLQSKAVARSRGHEANSSSARLPRRQALAARHGVAPAHGVALIVAELPAPGHVTVPAPATGVRGAGQANPKLLIQPPECYYARRID